MPFYNYKCTECEHEFNEMLKIDDRKIPEENPCPECGGEDCVHIVIGAPRLVTHTGTMIGKAGGEWKDLLGQIKKGSGKANTIHD